MEHISTALNITIAILTLLVMLNSFIKWSDNNDTEYKRRYKDKVVLIASSVGLISLLGWLIFGINNSYSEYIERITALHDFVEKEVEVNAGMALNSLILDITGAINSLALANTMTTLLLGLILLVTAVQNFKK